MIPADDARAEAEADARAAEWDAEAARLEELLARFDGPATVDVDVEGDRL